MRWPCRAIGVTLLITIASSGCGSDAKPSSAPGRSSAASSASPSGATSTTLSPAEAELKPLLLTATELGVTFTDAQLGAPHDTDQPCGQHDPLSIIHPQARVIVLLADYLEGLGVAENLSRFATIDDAQRVVRLVRDGVSCGQGTITNENSAEPVTLSAVQDVSAQVGAPEAFAVVVTLPDKSNITTIAARVDRSVVVFQIGSKGQQGALDPLQIATQGIAKITKG